MKKRKSQIHIDTRYGELNFYNVSRLSAYLKSKTKEVRIDDLNLCRSLLCPDNHLCEHCAGYVRDETAKLEVLSILVDFARAHYVK